MPLFIVSKFSRYCFDKRRRGWVVVKKIEFYRPMLVVFPDLFEVVWYCVVCFSSVLFGFKDMLMCNCSILCCIGCLAFAIFLCLIVFTQFLR